MSKDFDFTTEYTLDKQFFAECYDQTSRPSNGVKGYLKAILFLVFGVALVKFDLLPSGYVGWFFIVLSVVEALSVLFKRAWWLWRQTLGTSASSKVILQVNAKGMNYKSGKTDRTINWNQITHLEQSDLGLILYLGKQRQYVSKSCLSDEAIAYIVEQQAKANRGE